MGHFTKKNYRFRYFIKNHSQAAFYTLERLNEEEKSCFSLDIDLNNYYIRWGSLIPHLSFFTIRGVPTVFIWWLWFSIKADIRGYSEKI